MISPSQKVPAGYRPIPANRGTIFYAVDPSGFSLLAPADAPDHFTRYTYNGSVTVSLVTAQGHGSPNNAVLNTSQVWEKFFELLGLEEVADFVEMNPPQQRRTLHLALRGIGFRDPVVAGIYQAMGFPAFEPNSEGTALRAAIAAVHATYAHAIPAADPAAVTSFHSTALTTIVPNPGQEVPIEQLVKILQLLAHMPNADQVAREFRARYPYLRETLYQKILSAEAWNYFHDPANRSTMLQYASKELSTISLALYVGAADTSESLALLGLAVQCWEVSRSDPFLQSSPDPHTLVRTAFHLRQYQTMVDLSRDFYSHDTFLLLHCAQPDMASRYLTHFEQKTTEPSSTLYAALLDYGDRDLAERYLKRVRSNASTQLLTYFLDEIRHRRIARLEMAEYLAKRYIEQIEQCRAAPEMPPLPPIGDDIDAAIAQLDTIAPQAQYATTLAVLNRLIQMGHGRHAPNADPTYAPLFSRHAHRRFFRDLAALYRTHGCDHERSNLALSLAMEEQALAQSTLTILLQEEMVDLATQMVRCMDDLHAVFAGYAVLTAHHIGKKRDDIASQLVDEAMRIIDDNKESWEEKLRFAWKRDLQQLLPPATLNGGASVPHVPQDVSGLPAVGPISPNAIVRAILAKGPNTTEADWIFLGRYEATRNPMVTDPLHIVQLYLEYGARERAIAYLRQNLHYCDKGDIHPFLRRKYLEAVLTLEDPSVLQDVVNRLLRGPSSNLDALLQIAEQSLTG